MQTELSKTGFFKISKDVFIIEIAYKNIGKYVFYKASFNLLYCNHNRY